MGIREVLVFVIERKYKSKFDAMAPRCVVPRTIWAAACLVCHLLLSTKAWGETLDLSEIINPDSGRSRSMVSLQAMATSGPDFRIKRSTYPETDPHVCLAFLSCCGRTDLLNHTIAGAIRHMEEDEPFYLRYELAWVDNGNSESSTEYIKSSYPIEHALTIPQNMGLAYGMNMLIHNLCRAPYILFLEEDWLYLDEVVADQTEERKRSIATSIALLENLKENDVTAYDGRQVIGTFLRHETYESFLTFPHADIWERRKAVNLSLTFLPSSSDSCINKDTTTQDARSANGDDIVDIDYRIFCAVTAVKNGDTVWGSYTNGAGLYRRSDLIDVGRQYGEPGDAFHDRYVESNFAYRVGLGHCHAAVRLTKDETCAAIYDSRCTGAFHHIGGGRGTRPRTSEGTKCMDEAWNFLGTPMYEKFIKYVAQTSREHDQKCTRQELEELRQQQFRDTDAESYREEVRKANELVFQEEAKKRQELRDQANIILIALEKGDGDKLRDVIPWMNNFSDEDISETAHRMVRLAESPHPMGGFWDMHGRVKKSE